MHFLFGVWLQTPQILDSRYVSYFFANVILCADYEPHISLVLTSAYAFLSIQNRDCFYVNVIAATRDIKTSTTPRNIDF